MKDRMSIAEFENEVMNGEFQNIKLGKTKNTVKGLLMYFSNGSGKLEDYGGIGVIETHLLEPCGYHFEIVKNQ